jgi:DNA polymerase IV
MLGKKGQKKKKSKEVSIKLVPQNERIFKDLTFYYIPPDEKAPFRKFRIQKAREFGVTWAIDWNPESITHVIVDKGFKYESVMTFLKIDAWPSNIVLVNEDYPIDCTQHRFILDPKQGRYEIPGQNPSAVDKELPPVPASRTSDPYLEIKSAKSRSKNGAIPPIETPPRSQPSTQLRVTGDNHPQMTVDTCQGPWLEHEKSDSIAENPLETSFSENKPRKRQKKAGPGDALDDMIMVARGMQRLPLNDEEDENQTSRPSSRDDSSDSDSEEEVRRAKAQNSLNNKKTGTYGGGINQESFSCMKGGSGITPENNPNARTIEVLQEMTDYYVRMKDHWRQTAYRKAMSTLKRQTTKISTYEQAIVLPTIGERLALKIEEIVATNRLRRLENAKLEMNDHILDTFMKIYGVAVNQAWKWVQQGHKSLQDLLDCVHLTENQKLGIERYDDFLTRIPRDEVTALGDIVKNISAEIDPLVEVIIGGSYRRGAATSGDVDCLLTKPGTKISRDLLPFVNQLVSQLTASGFLVAALAVPSETGSASKWHGCCVLPGAEKPIWRRIDLLMVPEPELGAALIYFTGDDIFNRSMRLLSSRKGWRLNQQGLFKNVMRGPGRVKMNEGELMEGADEKKIFELLGVPWRVPEDRICH